ncbi:restriction endonuclease subunit S [Morganella morganii]|uniref:restriction endonuclease subunit S n=1 Tax=Morganella morganii TaxID=582 RepID=UPI001BDABDFB|nr:restriction endonuclease subunit S [Morganella morganii]EKU4001989.1 restriction endonuclease subunit S [Morganella morganii]MBT0407182.1 restriction endonuclease subunit S [Morganella morganii subsp. morganii]MBT0425628.1 restriction endonuclease subunit S [Morganella morganii subsp. morganii]MBT0472974.1 restriction endonuclease subunit S [Morganella morganii subsp. morganii]QWM00643.1 restriction endonuclease subunit S [Morganella morganii subsp. morganii]
MTVEKLITDHIDIWSSALQTRSAAGRGSNGKIDLYGIKKLRELILELAVRGKLVPQDPNDEPASELLKRIAAEKAELVKQGKIKKQKLLPEISEDEKPFELPAGWEWVRLNHVGHDWGQKTPENDFTYIDVGSINKELGTISKPGVINPKDAPSRARKIVRRNTVLYSTVRPYLLNIAVVDEDYDPEPIASTAFAIIHPWKGISSTFIYHYLRSPIFVSYVESCQTGIAYPAINDKQFLTGVIAIPPAEEQLRIVSKVNELMSLCDQLEQQSLLSLDAHQQLVETLLATLTDSQNAKELAENWVRISQHFDMLFTTEASIDALKQTILQLAVMGKLVPQDPDDEPASELLKRIEQEKAELVKEGKIKKQKPLPPVSDEEKPFELPEGWVWCRLAELVAIKGGKRVSNGYKLLTEPTPHVYIRVADMKDGTIDLSDLKYIDEEMHQKIKNYIITKDDIYMTIVGATIGKCGTVPALLDGMNLTENAARLIPSKLISKDYLYLCLRSDLCQEQFIDKTMQVGVQKMALNRLANTLIALPSTNESLRIRDRVKEMNKLCSKLVCGIIESQQTKLHLVDALTDAALN